LDLADMLSDGPWCDVGWVGHGCCFKFGIAREEPRLKAHKN